MLVPPRPPPAKWVYQLVPRSPGHGPSLFKPCAPRPLHPSCRPSQPSLPPSLPGTHSRPPLAHRPSGLSPDPPPSTLPRAHALHPAFLRGAPPWESWPWGSPPHPRPSSWAHSSVQVGLCGGCSSTAHPPPPRGQGPLPVCCQPPPHGVVVTRADARGALRPRRPDTHLDGLTAPTAPEPGATVIPIYRRGD